jgi:hypothetical protein
MTLIACLLDSDDDDTRIMKYKSSHYSYMIITIRIL